MFVPVPEAFNGSYRADRRPARPPVALTATFAGLSLLSASAAALVAAPFGWSACLAWSSLAMLVPALSGMCVTGLVAEDAGGMVGRLQQALAEQTAASPQSWAMHRHPDEPVLQAFVGMVADTVTQLRRLQAGRSRLQTEARAASRALQAGRDQAHQLGCTLKEDGASLADAAAGIMMASARLAQDTAVTEQSAESAERSVIDAVERAASLASATRATTAEITGMTRIAISASEAAFSAHRSVAALDGKVESLTSTARQVGTVLRAGAAKADPADSDHAADLRAMAEAVDHAMVAMQATLHELRAQTGAANSKLSELAELIGKQHEIGLSLTHTVQQQGEDLAALVAHLMETHAGFATLRAGVAAVTRSSTSRLAGAEALRGAASRLPGHADAIADIMRIIPNFSEPGE